MFFKHFFKNHKESQRIYLDYASSTPYDGTLFTDLKKISKSVLGANPSALHKEAVELKKVLEEGRAKIAKAIFAHSDEIVFTSSATESNNLAVLGLVKGYLQKGFKHEQIAICTSDIEHSSITEQVNYLKQSGVLHFSISSRNEVWDFKKIVFPERIKAVIFSVIYVNNEIGVVAPIKEIAKHIRGLRKEWNDVEFIFHIDATQAPLFYELRVDRLGIDMMTLGATKLYTHKGVGMLYKKRNIKLNPIILGGGQELGLRAGTESVDIIHHFVHAFLYAQKNIEKFSEKIKSFQKYFENKVETEISQAVVTAKETERSPHISHVAIPSIDSELLVIELDAKGIAISSKSACKNDSSTDTESASDITKEIYGDGYGAIRVSYGKWTTKSDLDKMVLALKKILEKYKDI